MKFHLFTYKLLFVILLFTHITSCDSDKEIPTIDIKGNNAICEIPFMRFPYRIGLNKEQLIILDMASDSMFYHVIKYPELKYQYSIGKRGSGPNEIVLPTPFQFYNDKLFLMDGINSKLMCFQQNDENIYTLQQKKELGSSRSVDFVIVNDSVTYIENLNGDSRIIKHTNKKAEKMFSIPSAVSNREDFNSVELALTWRSFMTYNGNLNKLALVTQMGDVLEIFDMNNNTAVVKYGKIGQPNTQKQIEGYHYVEWKDNKIYALYSGRDRDELDRNFNMGKRLPDGGNFIKVFSDNGDFIKQYRLDHFINSFTFCNEDNTIIGITSNQDEPLIYFDL